jgi:alkaline phosphatase D
MPSITRRTLFRWLAATPALPLIGSACTASDPQEAMFPQGVASGDPTPDSVLLWTRVESNSIESVRYEVATDPDFKAIVATGEQSVDESTDHTLRVQIDGLASGTPYWYRFTVRGVTSRVGRTKTAPDPTADVPLRIAVASCQDYGGRWFHAWRAIVDRDDIDVVLFIGDYIYETIGHLDVEWPADRTIELPDGLELDDAIKGKLTALTLADYRALYRQFRTDPDLRDAHAHFPFVSLWDDHEFANDCWGDHATDFDDRRGDEASPERRGAATRAYFEYQAIRRPFDASAGYPNDMSIYRTFRWGKHAEIVLLDERYYRDDILIPEGPIDREVGHIQMNSAFGSRTFVIKDAFDAREAAVSPAPTMLGATQRDWAINAVTSSTATWKLLASPLVMAQMAVDLTGYAQLPDQFRKKFYFKTDQWDGFRSERRALLEAVSGVDNLVVLSGDLHGFYASELYVDFDAPSAEPICVEYATSAISAPTVDVQINGAIESNVFLEALGLKDLVPEFDGNLATTNPHIKYADSTTNGLAIVEVGAAQVDVRFLLVSDVTSPTGRVIDEVAFRTPIGSRRVVYSPPCSG